MKRILFLLTLTISVFTIKAQDIYEVKRESNKFIYGEAIKLFAGDKIFVEANVINTSVKNFKIVNVISNPSNTITIEFKYGDFGNQQASLLKVNNPFNQRLSYKAKIQTTSNNFSETSILPVLPKIYSTEMWPNRIESIILSEFQLQ